MAKCAARPALWLLSFAAFVATDSRTVAAQGSQANAAQSLRKAQAAEQKGDYAAAVAAFRDALQQNPDSREAAEGLGVSLVASGDLKGAIEADRQALQRFPDDAKIRTNLGLALYRAGDIDRARGQLERVHAEHPENVEAAVLLGFAFNKLGRAEETYTLLQPLEAGHETNIDLKYALAFSMIQTGRADQGVARMEDVGRVRHAPDAWMIAGYTRFGLRQFAAAMLDAHEALQADDSFPGAHTLAGQTHYALGKREDAAEDFQAALKLNPRDFTANLYLGILKFDDRDLDAARPLLEMAYTLQPDNPLTRLELARLKNVQGDTEAALALFEGLEKSDPQWIDPHVDLAALYYKLHRPEDGKRERDVVQRLEAEQQQRGPQSKQKP